MNIPKGFNYREVTIAGGFNRRCDILTFITTIHGEEKGFYYSWIKHNLSSQNDIETEKGIALLNRKIVDFLLESKLFIHIYRKW